MADFLCAHVSEFIDRARLTGARDRGDVLNVRSAHNGKVTIEAKDHGGEYHIGAWLTEVEVERANDGAVAGVVVMKRRGIADPGRQVVVMTMADLVALLTGDRP